MDPRPASDQGQPPSKELFELETPLPASPAAVGPVSHDAPAPPPAAVPLESSDKPPASEGDSGVYEVHDDHKAHVEGGSQKIQLDPPVRVASAERMSVDDLPPTPAKSFKPDEPEEPAWPDAIAAVCMLLAGCGLLIHALKITLLVLTLTGNRHKVWMEEVADPKYWILIPQLMFEVVMLGLEIILFWGGLTMKLRWPSSIGTLRSWAKLKIPMVVLRMLGSWVLLVYPVYKLIRQMEPDSTYGHYQTVFMVIWSLVMVAWGLALPVFLLYWFRRQPVKDEIATWG